MEAESTFSFAMAVPKPPQLLGFHLRLMISARENLLVLARSGGGDMDDDRLGEFEEHVGAEDDNGRKPLILVVVSVVVSPSLLLSCLFLILLLFSTYTDSDRQRLARGTEFTTSLGSVCGLPSQMQAVTAGGISRQPFLLLQQRRNTCN